MFTRRLLLLQFLLLIGVSISSCSRNNGKQSVPEKLTVGVVNYGEIELSQEKYDRFKTYLSTQTRSIVEIEPTYNELRAVRQIRSRNWDIVFAPPGLAAIGIGKKGYKALFSMAQVSSIQTPLIVVRDDSSIESISDLTYKTIALGQKGSAAGYYVPLYDLFGLTLEEIQFAPTPKQLMEWISEGVVDAGAISKKNFERYRQVKPHADFRIIHEGRYIPSGVVLIAPTIERNRERQIQQIMQEAPAHIAADAGYVPNIKIPNYKQFIKLVEKIRPLEKQVEQKPAVLLYPPESNSSN